jgi:Spy/CpxP family protein refolding chaperone
MPSDSAPAARSGYNSPDDLTQDLPAQYERLREEMERLMAEPVKDFAAIDQLVDRLERLQLAIKEQHGIKGNNPNE